MWTIAPTAKKLWGRCPQVAPQEFCNVIFETVKCTLKIRIYNYASDKSCTDFSLKTHQSVWRPQPGPTGRAYSAPPDLQAGFKIGGRLAETREGGRGKDRRGGQLREEGTGRRGGTDGRQMEETGGEG